MKPCNLYRRLVLLAARVLSELVLMCLGIVAVGMVTLIFIFNFGIHLRIFFFGGNVAGHSEPIIAYK